MHACLRSHSMAGLGYQLLCHAWNFLIAGHLWYPSQVKSCQSTKNKRGLIVLCMVDLNKVFGTLCNVAGLRTLECVWIVGGLLAMKKLLSL